MQTKIRFGVSDLYYVGIDYLVFLLFPVEKYFPLSDRTKIKVIDKLEVADSESVFSLHENVLVSEICAFYLNKSDIHFIISSNTSAKKSFI